MGGISLSLEPFVTSPCKTKEILLFIYVIFPEGCNSYHIKRTNPANYPAFEKFCSSLNRPVVDSITDLTVVRIKSTSTFRPAHLFAPHHNHQGKHCHHNVFPQKRF